MNKKSSAAFFVGGILTMFLMLELNAFAEMMMGMSDGASTGPDDTYSVKIFFFLVCAYFFASSFGLLILKTKRALWVWATPVHAMLLFAYYTIFVSIKNDDSDGYAWPSDIVKITLIMAVYFLPWLTIWAYALSSYLRKSFFQPIYQKIMK